MEFSTHKTGFTVTQISPDEQREVAQKSKETVIDDIEKAVLLVYRGLLALITTTKSPIKIDWNDLAVEYPNIQIHLIRKAIGLFGLTLERDFKVEFPNKSTRRNFRRSCNGNVRNNEPGSKIKRLVVSGTLRDGDTLGSFSIIGRRKSN